MSEYIIKGGRKIEGEVTISGSKNASLPIIAASILNQGRTTLYNVPNIHDTQMMFEILRKLGATVTEKKKKVIIDTTEINQYEIPEELMRQMRSSVIFVGALVGRYGKVTFSYPGGCDIWWIHIVKIRSALTGRISKKVENYVKLCYNISIKEQVALNFKYQEDTNMKAIVENITLKLYGREMSFSKEELTAILEKHYSKTEIVKGVRRRLSKIPAEGVYFSVNPHLMDLRFFENLSFENTLQEWTRKRIVKALKKVQENPKKYAKPFKIKWLKKDWDVKTLKELKEMVAKEGDHPTDSVEQALELAQRILNGETWEEVCNQPDTAEHYRLIEDEDGIWIVVGGSTEADHNSPPAGMDYTVSDDDDRLQYTTPSVVCYD